MIEINSSRNKKIRKAYIELFSDVIDSKINYEMSMPHYKGPLTANDYRKKCLFSLTVQPNSSGNTVSIYNAQRNIERQFSEYYSKVFRQRCVHNHSMTKRTKFLQPLVITCFDVEGSRFRRDQGWTSVPHYHGLVLFHHDTTDTFFRGIRSDTEVDGQYRIVKPHPVINSIFMDSIPTRDDMRKFLDYSTKYSKVLTNQDTNYCPANFYPMASKYFNFWRYYKTVRDANAAQADDNRVVAFPAEIVETEHRPLIH